MKIFLWLILTVTFIVIYSVGTQLKNQSETKSEQVTSPAEEKSEASPLAEPITLSFFPETIIQGEPLRITIHGTTSPSLIQSLTFDDEPLPIFVDKNKVTALVGIDFHKKAGSYPLTLTLYDGRVIREKITVGQRAVTTTGFDIPEELGGNTPQAEHQLSESLAKDTAIINSVVVATGPEKLWEGSFRLPLDGPSVVTDVYGYKRQTGSVSLSHQGTDFWASEGTPVYAMNSGKVVFAGTFRNYGHTVIIDHGLGLMTAYMHLSETKVVLDENVEKGDLIALSGNTGYSLGPHLHLSVRINGFTIDPIKFLELMSSQ